MNLFLNVIIYKKHIFIYDFFEKNIIHFLIKQISNKTNNKDVINTSYIGESNFENAIHEIKFIPSYFNVLYHDLPPSYNLIKFKRVDQFLINLDGYFGVQEYLKSRMGPKSQSQLRRRINRLELCFDIRYAFYYGEIAKPIYDSLFHSCELFIERRFEQRGDIFSSKDRWDDIKESSYQMILEKKASLFVIYCNEKPIDICLNYHFQNVVNAVIRSYDIDYSKFWLGQIDLYKQIEWCFNNDFLIYDLMWGELEYKLRWANEIKKYDHHFIYQDNKRFKTVFVRIIIQLYRINDFLKKRDIYKLFHKIRVKFSKMIPLKLAEKELVLRVETLLELPLNDSITKINVHSEEYSFLKKPVYDFQYLNSETGATINVFKMTNNKNSYIIKGKQQQIKIIVNYRNQCS
jgi:hypothetical protein